MVHLAVVHDDDGHDDDDGSGRKPAESEEEKDEVINEAKQILDVEDVIASILMVDDLRIQKN